MEKPVLIVKFDDESIGITLEDWTFKKQDKLFTYWPPYWRISTKLRTAIERREEVNSATWESFSISIMKTFGITKFFKFIS